MPPPPEYLDYLPPHTITHARMHARTHKFGIFHTVLSKKQCFCNFYAVFGDFD